MILIQIVLILMFVYIMVRFISDPSGTQIKAWKKILGILFFFGAIFSVLFPGVLNKLANLFGVGRGADLLLYLLTLAFILVVSNAYIHSKQDQKRLVILARKVALLDAEFRQQKVSHPDS